MQGKAVLGMAAASPRHPRLPCVGLGREMLCTTRACPHPRLCQRARGRQQERGSFPIPATLFCPASEHPQGDSAAPPGARVKAKSKAAAGRVRGKDSLIRDRPGQTAKLTAMWRHTLLRGGGERKRAWPGGREASYERSLLPVEGLPRHGGAGLLQLQLCRCISPQGAANSSGTPWPQQVPALNS